MTGRRTSARQAAKASSNSSSTQNDTSSKAGDKRKADSAQQGKVKKGKKDSGEDQSTIEAFLPSEQTNGSTNKNEKANSNDEDEKMSVGNYDDQAPPGQQDQRKELDSKSSDETSKEDKPQETMKNGFNEIMSKDSKQEKGTPEGTGSKVSSKDDAIERSSERADAQPSNILEKGIIYFFFRGRVGIEEPNSVGDVARSYIVLRPMPMDAKLGDGPIGDSGRNRLLALPKKVLPKSPRDRFMTFVDRAGVSLDDIKEQFASSDYSTKTSGVRHAPAATPIGEGVYAFTQTGRDTHLAYIITIPKDPGDLHESIGLRQRGSFLTSAKNPQSSGPANAQLPQGAEYPKEIQDEFGGRGWMPLHPKLLDYENTQFLLIGHGDDALEKAAKPSDSDQADKKKETPLEEIEKLEDEDEKRVQGLSEDHAIFADLGMSSNEYPNVQTTW